MDDFALKIFTSADNHSITENNKLVFLKRLSCEGCEGFSPNVESSPMDDFALKIFTSADNHSITENNKLVFLKRLSCEGCEGFSPNVESSPRLKSQSKIEPQEALEGLLALQGRRGAVHLALPPDEDSIWQSELSPMRAAGKRRRQP